MTKMENKWRKPKVLILLAAGINCDRETEFAFNLAGGVAERVHINEFIYGRKNLVEYHILVFPGGFSFGDDVASGKVLANKLKHRLGSQIQKFIEEKKLILGICNGFQVMVKLGILPGFNQDYQSQKTTLTFNDSGRFEDRWVYLKGNPKSPCIFTQGREKIRRLIYLPVRHGEGKFICKDKNVLTELKEKNQTVFQYVDDEGNFGSYPVNPNGSQEHIAGICDESGLVFGLMPHPEGYIRRTQHPQWTRKRLPQEGDGFAIFKNAIHYARDSIM